ncbi:MAG TPA: DOMON-like domain-containing protein [Brevundimonas sp.]|nr:DOMON-like domain-containing protein [Brevundimonas sp.]
MIFERRLHPYPTLTAVPGHLEVEVDWEGRSWLYAVFRASGFGPDLLLPTEGRGRQDELWKHTCCEVFGLRAEGGYVEFNLSPSGAWAAYSFDGYRDGMANLEVQEPRITCRPTEDGFELTVILHWTDWPQVQALGVSVVTETARGVKTYWALEHPSDKPDFHHPDSFVLELP